MNLIETKFLEPEGLVFTGGEGKGLKNAMAFVAPQCSFLEKVIPHFRLLFHAIADHMAS